MKRALMYASVASMIQQFNMDNIKLLQELGYKVEVACNFMFGNTISDEKIQLLKDELDHLNVKYYHIPIPRKLSDVKNLMQSYVETKRIMDNRRYELIHCHSPIGGIICRIANRTSKEYKETKMIYTAHGFHFFKGNHWIKNLIFRTVEKIGARYTDILITINKEDYAAASCFRMKNKGKVEYVPGIGIDLNKISPVQAERQMLLNELGIQDDASLLLSVGELNENKNHRVVIESLPKLRENVHYIICGQGNLKNEHIQLAKDLGVSDRLHLLGYRSDITKIMKSSDVFVFPSKREGLSVALMEAMACGLPCVVSKIRGNTDLIDDGKGGMLFDDGAQLSREIIQVMESDSRRKEMSMYNVSKIKTFSRTEVEKKMRDIYKL